MDDPPADAPEPVEWTDGGRARRRRRWRRLALALGVLLLVVGGAWHALFFWAKSTGRLESWLGRRADRFQARWSEIRSPLPFVFEADDLVLDVRTQRQSWELTAERARVGIDPIALLDRRLVLRGARASGVTFHLAHEPVPDDSAAPKTIAPRATGEHRPKITAFADRPVPIPSQKRKPWSWIVSALAVEGVREVWIDDLRVTGSASAELAFSLRRREWAEIERSALHLERAKVTVGGAPFSAQLAGEVGLQVVPWRYRGMRASELLPHLQGTLELDGDASLGPVLRYLFGDWPWLELGADRSAIELALVVDRGRLREGSRLSAALADPALDAFGFAVRGSALLDARVTGERDQERVASRLELGSWTLARPGEAVLFTGEGLVVDAELEAPRLGELPAAGELSIDLGRGRANDLRFVNDFLPAAAGIAVERGALELTGKLRFAGSGRPGEGDRSGAGEVAIRGDRLALVARGQRLIADLAVELRLSDPDFTAGSFALGGSTLALRKVGAASTAGATIEDWWGETELVSGRVTLRRPFESAGEIRSRIANTQPVIAFYELKRDLPRWAERAILVDDVNLSGRYRVTAGRLQMSDVLIPFTNGSARAELDLSRARRRARLLLSWRKLDLGVEIDGEKRDLRLLRAREWFERGPRLRP